MAAAVQDTVGVKEIAMSAAVQDTVEVEEIAVAAAVQYTVRIAFFCEWQEVAATVAAVARDQGMETDYNLRAAASGRK